MNVLVEAFKRLFAVPALRHHGLSWRSILLELWGRS